MPTQRRDITRRMMMVVLMPTPAVTVRVFVMMSTAAIIMCMFVMIAATVVHMLMMMFMPAGTFFFCHLLTS